MRYFKTLITLLFSLIVSINAEEVFKHQYHIFVPTSVKDSELVAVPFEQTMFENLRYDLNDLRLFSIDNRSTPFTIAQQRNIVTDSVYQFRQLKVSNVVVTADSLKATLSYFKTVPISALKLSTVLKDFELAVTVYNSDGTVLTNNSSIYDYSSYADSRNETVYFDTVNTKSLTVEINGLRKLQKKAYYELKESFSSGGDKAEERKSSIINQKPKFQFLCGITKLLSKTTVSYAKVDSSYTPSEILHEADKTVVSIDSKQLPITSLFFDIEEKNFSRPIHVYRIVEGQRYTIFSGTIEQWNYRKYKKSATTVAFRESRCERLVVEIFNGGKSPLSIKNVQPSMPKYAIYYLHEAGKEYVVKYGNKTLSSTDSHTALPNGLLRSGHDTLLTGELRNLESMQQAIRIKSTEIKSNYIIYPLIIFIFIFLTWMIATTISKAEKIND